MTSEDTVIWNPLLTMKPSIFPPIPMTISRNACAQKSIAQPIGRFRGSMFSRLSPRLASCSSV